MTEIKNPLELFVHELGDILYVERALAEEALPSLIEDAKDEEFRSALENHLEQTRTHSRNVERVFAEIGEEPQAEKCLGFEGLKKEREQLLDEASPGLAELIDVGAAARTECYEIAAYEGLRRMAKAMGEDKAVDLLDQNLRDEKEALNEVEKVATRLTKEGAAAMA